MQEPCIRHKATRRDSMLLLLLLLLLPQKNDSANYSCDFEVKFISQNFKNILTWSTPRNTEGVRYNVMYTEYGNNTWWEKAECTNITLNWCDLSNETFPHTEQYYGKVLINNQGCNISRKTDRFYPLRDTKLDPPKVNLYSTSTSITINLTHVVEHLSSIYDGLRYEIQISGIGPKISTFHTEEPYYKIDNLDLKTQYCVSAELVYYSKRVFSNQTCILTKTDHTSEDRIQIMLYSLAVILVVIIVFGAGYAVHKYIHVGNLMQPQILNITSNNNNNVVLVDAHKVAINIIKIESSKSNEQCTMMAEKEEKTQVKTDLYFTDGGYDVGHSSGVTEDNDHGYVSLLVQVPATRPQVSPYDMPHHLEMPVKTSMAPADIINLGKDLYGRIKCNENIAPIQEKNTVEALQKAEALCTYLPKSDQNFPKLDILKHELHEIEESSIEQAVDNTDVAEHTDFSECDTLFVDWSPTSHHLYMPNFHEKAVDEVGTEECREAEGLLSHLYKPIQIAGTSEELACLEQRWELHVDMQE